MDGLVSIACIVAMLFAAGGVIALVRPGSVDWRWLAIAAGLVILNDALLTRGYGLLPELVPDARWNWQGKLLALAATLGIAALPAFGWRHAGITLRQARGSLLSAVPVVLVYCGFFLAIALAFPDDPPSRETIAFQLTMPGLEEEIFYRGLLLLALDRAFLSRVRWLGVDWGWGAIVSCALFGLAHAFGYADGSLSFDPIVMALTAVPSLIAVWLRLRTGSVAMPIVLHNFGNAIGLLV
ncbi:CPBP family intramembrane glutamic endopeptidase, BDIM_20840 family [Sphingomonas radiodurans]|uniref:CPBP family intramembrane glutamic endopeptidase, BDIM_20840 family n=1 Tax=Sphingomonas radiodurans TaxID=2890321 RepID=UPI001E56371F|nr:CPBP family intramembrane glutamic endopeptidase [Sphingomonas radiodurans]WBH15951.1 CPBP family intramembrane metalloprotease [Sphingomonas radiodurans]